MVSEAIPISDAHKNNLKKITKETLLFRDLVPGNHTTQSHVPNLNFSFHTKDLH